MGSVILYETKRRISLTIDGRAGLLTRNMAMHNPDFLAFKASQTDIEFIVRNVDRKPINLTGRKLFATLVNYYSGATMAVVPLAIVDAARGICRLTFEPFMVKDIPLGTHRYTVSYMLDNGNAKLLMLDQYETIGGYFEMQFGAELQGIQSQEALFTEFYTEMSNRYDTYFVSPNFKGNLQNGSLSGLHTLAFYMRDWTGSFWVEGSLVAETPEEQDYFPVLIDDMIEKRVDLRSGVLAYNLKMNLNWVRVKILPDQFNMGSISKVMFRN